MKALLLENIHPEGVRLLTEREIEVETDKGALDEAELIAALDGVRLLGIRSKTNVTKTVLDSAPDLQAIGAFCIGTNQIELAAAASRGIPVFNAPFSNTRSVVELVIAEIIALARHLTDKNAKMHAGIWDKSARVRMRYEAERWASSVTATSAPSCRSSPSRLVCGSTSTTSPTSSRSAMLGAARLSTNCWR